MNREDQINQYRIFHIAANAVIPLIESMQVDTTDRLLAKFRDGQTDLTTIVAKLEVLSSLKEDIINKANLYESYATKD